MHDASEAYIADIIRPVKIHLQNYLEIEAMIMNCIWEKYGLQDLTEEEISNWKQIDDDILAFELKNLMNGWQKIAIPQLSSIPDISEKNWIDVQNKFLDAIRNFF